MAEKNFAMLGAWHVHAGGYARELNQIEGCHVSKVWDPDKEKADAWAKELGCESASVEAILRDPAIDGVVVCCATNEHAPLIIKACESGKAVFSEKVLALTTKEALEIQAAVEKNGTRFAISFPHTSEPGVRFALETAKSGKLGQINYARVRKAHNGATGNWLPPHFYDPIACGGGAMVDLGAHPVYLLCELLGEPDSVQSALTHVTGKAVEDNAVSVMTFQGGAIGVAETGFLSVHYPFTVELGGTLGGLLLRDGNVEYCCPETDNQWKKPDTLPSRLPSPLEQWALAQGPKDIAREIDIRAAVRLTKAMEAVYTR